MEASPTKSAVMTPSVGLVCAAAARVRQRVAARKRSFFIVVVVCLDSLDILDDLDVPDF
jgi:hypothetical protein